MTRVRALIALDVTVVALLMVSAQVQVWSSTGPWTGGRLLHATLSLLITGPLLIRRRHPLPVFVTVVAASGIQFSFGGGLGQAWFAVLLALYAVGAHANQAQSLVGPGFVLATVLLVDVPRLADGEPVEDVVPAWFFLMGTWAFGRWMRHRREETATLTHRVAQADRAREEGVAAAVAQERGRIALELHDLIAHSMGIIVIQAQGAQRCLPHDAERAAAALAAIESTGRNGLAEMRRLLALLEMPDAGDPTTPQPDIDHIANLVADVCAAGMPVELSISGAAHEVPPGVGLAAYRIVQEALTNALKHAGPATARVYVRRHTDRVEVEVCDTGKTTTVPSSSGHGLIGMRERVALYGGSVDAGPVQGGGFNVRAVIPVARMPS